MNGNQLLTLRDQREKHPSFLEVINTEKLSWATIQHKGISHSEVQNLYRKTRSIYEKIILNDYQSVDLQEIEYSLWKLHYKHIDEYRKNIKKVSTSAESTNNLNNHVEGFKLFLSEVAEFYNDLIEKFRKTCGISEEILFLKKNGVEPAILQKCRYACHRFLVCLGDLSRYMELCKKPDVQKWGVAATYYVEATAVWPDSGNAQNQLALLATYIGDDFLALYHCIRSLAVNEPFPDAQDNIMLLFEKNKSSKLQSLSTEAHIDFSKPLKRLSSQIKSHSITDSTNINKLRANENVPPAKTDLWSLFVRMISFFVFKPSFDDLPHTFASTMKELEALLAQNDVELNSSLEPYEPFDSSRKGPYRAIQAVTILIFVIHNLTRKKDELSTSITWAWAFTFSCLAHFIQRCQENHCSLLPAVLVFIEWYFGILDYTETYDKDEKVSNAKSYFFSALVDLLNRFDINEHDVNQTALWEDHELRGFEPVSQTNDLLDFYTHSENRRNVEDGNDIRINRILHVSVKIAEKLNGSSQNPIFYDQSERKFYTDKDSGMFQKKKQTEMEDEEVILFKPLPRYNSEPIQISNDKRVDPSETSDDSLRRSSSLFSPQNGSNGYQDSSKRAPPDSTGPPSLSGWVVNKESLNLEKSKSQNKRELDPILEIPTSSLSEAEYYDPIPSAPWLPEDPVWLRGSSLTEEHGILGAPPHSRLQEPLAFNSGVPGFIDAYRPPVFGLSSSEWLYRYNNNLSLELPNPSHHCRVLGNNSPQNVGNFHGYDGGPRFDLIDKWGNPLLTNRKVYFENPNQRDKLLFGYQRPNDGGELRGEQPPLLQHLKEREWQLQNESPFRGHPYMGN